MVRHINPHGHHIGGLTGFLKSIGYVIRTIKPTRVILVFDGLGGSTAKRNLYPDYKANRKLSRITNWEGFDDKEEESEAITNQILRLIGYLKCLPVDLLVIDKVEADDVIGHLAKVFDNEVYIVSTDKDYLQLVSDKVSLYSPIKKKFYRPKDVLEEVGISAQNYLNYKILAGDQSDNVPGIRGLQAKKILKLFPELREDTRFHLTDILKQSEKLKEDHKMYRSILDFQKQLEINNLLMNLHEPILSDEHKFEIQNIIDTPNRVMNITEFLQMYNEDLLGNSISNPQVWLYDTFHYLKVFKKL